MSVASYWYYILDPRPGATPADAARAAVSQPEMYWAITGRAPSQAAAAVRAAAGGIVVFAAGRDMALRRGRDRLRLQFTAQARALALTDLDTRTARRDAGAVIRAIGLPGWAVAPALADAIHSAYCTALHEHTQGASQR